MPTFIYCMGSEGGSDGGRLVVKVEQDLTAVGEALQGASGLLRLERTNGVPVLVNPAAVAYAVAARER